jgi:3-dehydroquinate dehydratase/shikimate dehydrogenase
LHNAAFRRTKLNAVYLPMRVPPDEFAETLQAYESLGVRGYSVTIPHKEAALKFAELADEASREIGAANTLFKDAQGRWCAANTDYQAALDSIRLGLEIKGVESLSGLRVLILGAGGVARAIGRGASQHGAVVMLSNRSKDRGSKLADELRCQFITWANRGSVAADVIVNCTPVGMSPHMNESPYEQYWFRDGTVVFDTIYNPENTLFIKEAREHECHVVSGVEMFVRQAAAQFKYFTNREASLDDMRTTLRRGISPVRVKTESGHASPTEAAEQQPQAPPEEPA